MKLNPMQLCRVAAFVDGLRIIAEKESDRGIELTEIPTEGIKMLQNFTVERGTQYAARNFSDLSFPDETEREEIPLRHRDAFDADPEMIEQNLDASAELLGGILAIRTGVLRY